MPNFHIVSGGRWNLAQIAVDAAADLRPGHLMWDLSQALPATVHQPGDCPPAFVDRIRSLLCGTPDYWALARQVRERVAPGDVVYCLGEDIGILVAALCGGERGGPRIATLIINANRPRARAALRFYRSRRRIALFLAGVPSQAEFIRDFLRLPDDRIVFVDDQTDTDFFTPGQPSADKRRPTIVSGGLEKRDYRTLAAATAGLDADVKICAFSPDASKLASAFPETLPANMSAAFYDWPELRQLYRDADIVVLPLLPNNYSAGLTTMMEAMACRRPVIATHSAGIIDQLARERALTAVSGGDAVALNDAINQMLSDPVAAEEQAQRGFETVHRRFNKRHATAELVSILRTLAA